MALWPFLAALGLGAFMIGLGLITVTALRTNNDVRHLVEESKEVSELNMELLEQLKAQEGRTAKLAAEVVAELRQFLHDDILNHEESSVIGHNEILKGHPGGRHVHPRPPATTTTTTTERRRPSATTTTTRPRSTTTTTTSTTTTTQPCPTIPVVGRCRP